MRCPPCLLTLTPRALDFNGLVGTLPSTGFPLRLTTLSLQGNPGLTGQIPDLLTALPSVRSIYLNQSGLNGTLPTGLSAMTSLRVLYAFPALLSAILRITQSVAPFPTPSEMSHSLNNCKASPAAISCLLPSPHPTPL